MALGTIDITSSRDRGGGPKTFVGALAPHMRGLRPLGKTQPPRRGKTCARGLMCARMYSHAHTQCTSARVCAYFCAHAGRHVSACLPARVYTGLTHLDTELMCSWRQWRCFVFSSPFSICLTRRQLGSLHSVTWHLSRCLLQSFWKTPPLIQEVPKRPLNLLELAPRKTGFLFFFFFSFPFG